MSKLTATEAGAQTEGNTDSDINAHLREQLSGRALADVVCGDPVLLERARLIPEYQGAADKTALQVVLPDLATIASAPPRPWKRSCTANEEDSSPVQPEEGRWAVGRDKNGVVSTYGVAYDALATIVERKCGELMNDAEQGTRESLARAADIAQGLVAVGRLYKKVEPRHQLMELKIPGHKELIAFAVERLIRVAARLKHGALADAACKLMLGTSFDRLTEHDVTNKYFDVRQARGLDPGWTVPPDDADLYGIGWAMLNNTGKNGGLSALRLLVTLTSAERWLVAQTAIGLLGPATGAARDGSHTKPAGPSPLLDGLREMLVNPEAGELQGIFATAAVIGMLARSENPGLLLRCGLGSALVTGWKDATRPLTSALSAYVLSDLCQETYEPCHASFTWESVKSEEEISVMMPPEYYEKDNPDRVELWRDKMRATRASNLMSKEEWEAGCDMFRAELADAGVRLPPKRPGKREGAAPDIPAPAPEDGLETLPSDADALRAAWMALPVPAEPPTNCDPWEVYYKLISKIESAFEDDLAENEPRGPYNELA